MKRAILYTLIAMMAFFTSCAKNKEQEFELNVIDVTDNRIIGTITIDDKAETVAIDYECAKDFKNSKAMVITCKKSDIIICEEDYTVKGSNQAIKITKMIKNPKYIRSIDNQDNSEVLVDEKPVIYLYPTEKTEVNVKLDFNGKLTTTYPLYNNGWNVNANPDGTLINHADGKEYSYLYWEGESNAEYDISKGFVVKGSETMLFLQTKLAEMGLTPKEYNEFIVYWLPKMQENKYNLISFQTTAYTENAKLEITPKPDSILRVFMVFKSLEEPIQIEPQTFAPFTRNGFTVVEWGGSEISK